jgi:hypothetical protein
MTWPLNGEVYPAAGSHGEQMPKRSQQFHDSLFLRDLTKADESEGAVTACS